MVGNPVTMTDGNYALLTCHGHVVHCAVLIDPAHTDTYTYQTRQLKTSKDQQTKDSKKPTSKVSFSTICTIRILKR